MVDFYVTVMDFRVTFHDHFLKHSGVFGRIYKSNRHGFIIKKSAKKGMRKSLFIAKPT
jgi:hypothetical protein